MIESCHTYEWVMSHICMSHVTHIHDSRHTYEWVTHTNESRHTYEWVICVAQETLTEWCAMCLRDTSDVWRKSVCVCMCVTRVCDTDESHACAIWKCVCVCVWHIRCVAQVCVCVCVAHPNCTSLCVCATHPTYSCRTYAIHVARVNEITTHIHNQATTHSTYAYTPQLWHPLSKHKMSIWKRHDPCTCARRIWKRPLYTLLDNKFMHYLFHTLFFSCIIYFIHYDFDHCTFFIYDGQDHRISYVVNEITTRYVMDSCMIDVIHYGGDYYTLV